MNVDWDEAPQGAEDGHLGGEGLYPAWFRKDVAGLVEQICPAAGINTWTWMGGRKDFPVGSVLRPPILLGHAPYASQWNGEGRPPAGTTCEIFAFGRPWEKANILYMGDACCVWITDGDSERGADIINLKFRPALTPEQIAAEERLQKAIELYGAVMDHSGASFKSLPVERQEHYLGLIDKGWQKVDRA